MCNIVILKGNNHISIGGGGRFTRDSQAEMHSEELFIYFWARSLKQMVKLVKVGEKESESQMQVVLCDLTTFLQITTVFRRHLWATKKKKHPCSDPLIHYAELYRVGYN